MPKILGAKKRENRQKDGAMKLRYRNRRRSLKPLLSRRVRLIAWFAGRKKKSAVRTIWLYFKRNIISHSRRAGIIAAVFILVIASLFVNAEPSPPLAHKIIYPQSCKGTWRGMNNVFTQELDAGALPAEFSFINSAWPALGETAIAAVDGKEKYNAFTVTLPTLDQDIVNELEVNEGMSAPADNQPPKNQDLQLIFPSEDSAEDDKQNEAGNQIETELSPQLPNAEPAEEPASAAPLDMPPALEQGSPDTPPLRSQLDETEPQDQPAPSPVPDAPDESAPPTAEPSALNNLFKKLVGAVLAQEIITESVEESAVESPADGTAADNAAPLDNAEISPAQSPAESKATNEDASENSGADENSGSLDSGTEPAFSPAGQRGREAVSQPEAPREDSEGGSQTRAAPPALLNDLANENISIDSPIADEDEEKDGFAETINPVRNSREVLRSPRELYRDVTRAPQGAGQSIISNGIKSAAKKAGEIISETVEKAADILISKKQQNQTDDTDAEAGAADEIPEASSDSSLLGKVIETIGKAISSIIDFIAPAPLASPDTSPLNAPSNNEAVLQSENGTMACADFSVPDETAIQEVSLGVNYAIKNENYADNPVSGELAAEYSQDGTEWLTMRPRRAKSNSDKVQPDYHYFDFAENFDKSRLNQTMVRLRWYGSFDKPEVYPVRELVRDNRPRARIEPPDSAASREAFSNGVFVDSLWLDIARIASADDAEQQKSPELKAKKAKKDFAAAEDPVFTLTFDPLSPLSGEEALSNGEVGAVIDAPILPVREKYRKRIEAIGVMLMETSRSIVSSALAAVEANIDQGGSAASKTADGPETGSGTETASVAETLGAAETAADKAEGAVWREGNLNIYARLLSKDREPTDIAPEIKRVNSGEFSLEISARVFKPGAYILETTLEQGGKTVTLEQDFSWGVLVVNTDQSVYAPGDAVNLAFGVLNENGHTICDAVIDSIIIAPTGEETYFSTADNSILRSTECMGDSTTDSPDYTALYNATDVGTYFIQVTADNGNGSKTIADSFLVTDPLPYRVRRVGATRIYPYSNYKMTLEITTEQSFAGAIAEYVPVDFEITADSAFTISELDEIKTLTWQVNIPAGEKIILVYEYDAPDISPEIFKLGPLIITSSNGAVVFSEFRQWAIASDVNRTWDNGSGNGLASTCQNWSSDTCPTSADNALFNSTSTANVTWDNHANTPSGVGYFWMYSTYTGTITMQKDLTVNMALVLDGGILNAGATTITLTATGSPFVRNGGTFNYGTSAVSYRGTGSVTVLAMAGSGGSNGYYNLYASGTGTYTLGGATRANNNVIVASTSGTATFNTSGQTLNVGADMSVGGFCVCIGVINLSTSIVDVNGNVFGWLTSGDSLTMTSGSLTVGGNWIYSSTATFDAGTGTVVFDAGDSGNTIDIGAADSSHDFNNVQFNNSAGSWTFQTTAATITGDLTVTAATQVNASVAVTVNGNVSCGDTCGTINITNAVTFTQSVDVAKNFGTNVAVSTAWTFSSLTFTATSDIITTSSTGTGNINVTGTLTISASTTLDAGNRTFVLSGSSGSPFVKTGTFTYNTSTIKYTGTTVTVLAMTGTGGNDGYYNLTVDGTGPYNLSGETVANNATTITNGTIDTRPSITDYSLTTGTLAIAVGGTLDAAGSSSTIDITGTGSAFTNSGTFNYGTSTVSYTNATSATIRAMTGTGGTNGYYDLKTGGAGTYTLGGSTIANHAVNASAGTLALSTYNLTVGTGSTTGDIYGGGAITQAASGTTTIIGAGVIGGGQATTCGGGASGSYQFYNLTVGDNANAKTTTMCGSFTVSNLLTIAGGTATQNLSAGSYGITLSGTGTVFTNNGTFTYGTSTVSYTNATSATILAMTGSGGSNGYYNLYATGAGTYTLGGATRANNNVIVASTSGTATFNTSGQTLNVGADMSVGVFCVCIGVINLSTSIVDVNGNVFGWLTSGDSLTMTSGSLTVGGNWIYSSTATFDAGTGTVVFDAGDSGNTIDIGAADSNHDFNNVIFNNSAGSWTFQTTAATITGDLTVTAATQVNASVNVTVNGNVVGTAGVINITNSVTFEQRVTGAKNFGPTTASTNWTFSTLIFSNGNGGATPITITAQSCSTCGVTVSSVLNVGKTGDAAGATTTLNAGDKTWTLSGTGGDPFQILASPAGDLTPATSTFVYTGNNGGGNTTVQSETYNALQVNNGSEIYALEGTTGGSTVTITAGTLDTGANALTATGDLTVTGTLQGTGNVTANGNVTGAGTITLTGGTFEQIVAADKTFGSSSGANTWTFSGLKFNNSSGVTFRIITPNAGTGDIVVSGTLTLGDSGTQAIIFDNNSANDRVFDLNGALLISTQGTFNASNSATFTIAGSFTNNGTFTHGSGTVTFDTTGTVTLAGTGSPAITFYNLTSTTGAKTIQFTASQTFRINGKLTITGASGSQIHIHSTSGVTQWLINHQGTEDVTYAHIEDSGCDGASTNISLNHTSTDGDGNNGSCWLFPSLSFTIDDTSVDLSLTSGNSFTTTATNTLTVTARAEFGYNLTAYETGILTHTAYPSRTILDWTGTNDTPTTWTTTCIASSTCGFGYSTNDADLTQFSSTKYAGFITTGPGEIVAKSTGPVTSDATIITYRSSVSAIQEAGPYQTTIIYIVTPQF